MPEFIRSNVRFLQSLLDTNPLVTIDGGSWVIVDGAEEMIPRRGDRFPPGSLESLCQPLPYTPLQPYLPYMPNARLSPPTRILSWVFRPILQAESILQAPELVKVKDDLLNSIVDHYGSVRRLLAFMSGCIDVNLRLFDDGYQTDSLREAEGAENVLREVTKAKEKMMVLLGICRLGLALANAEQRREIFFHHGDYLRSWDWSMPLVGMIVATDDPLTYLASLRELRENHVPLYIQVMEGRPSGEEDTPSSPATETRIEPPLIPTGSPAATENSADGEPLLGRLHEFLDAIPLFTPLPLHEAPAVLREEAGSWSNEMLEDAYLVMDVFPEVKLRVKRIVDNLTIEETFTAPPYRATTRLQHGGRATALSSSSIRRQAPCVPIGLRRPMGPIQSENLRVIAPPTFGSLLAQGRDRMALGRGIRRFKAPARVVCATINDGCRLVSRLQRMSEDTGETTLPLTRPLALLGTSVDSRDGVLRSWWPSQTAMDLGFGRCGEWSLENEAWFRRRLLLVSSGNIVARPLTELQWIDALRDLALPADGARTDMATQEEKAEEALQLLERAMGPWQMRKLSELR
ncbi:hypothetical protein NLI96_g12796 [Meripilus lineatus]|uniref:Uncharacterized protein n=1 Tax=Meripilus lineatus TaxID=2056292 RepID=A0AAD5UT56_9APHY|nr:hypothetical protein NLI96_g12796 [Physisporinus lineatus]